MTNDKICTVSAGFRSGKLQRKEAKFEFINGFGKWEHVEDFMTFQEIAATENQFLPPEFKNKIGRKHENRKSN